MSDYDFCEMAYLNGERQGEANTKISIGKDFARFVEHYFGLEDKCLCGHKKLNFIYNYCPYCGEKYDTREKGC